MTNLLKTIERNQKVLALLLIFVVVFILIRAPGLDSPLHQDEYKWPLIVDPSSSYEIKALPHPPLSQFIYRAGGEIVGYDTDFRFIPLFFGTLNLLLLFYFMNTFFGKKEAIIASLIWVFSYFSVLASLMVDTDGAIMPFFFLISLIGYYKLRFSEKSNFWMWFLLTLGIIGGFLVKISFLLVPMAFVADFLWSKRSLVTKSQLVKYSMYGFFSLLGLSLVLFMAKFIFPFFNFFGSVTYLTRFLTGSRGWFQTGIQVVKALLYLSPLLVLAPFFGFKKMFSKASVFIFFIILAFIFYIVLFDSSLGALDRYLQLLILPLTALTSIVLASINFKENPAYKKFLIAGSIVGVIIFLFQFLPHTVPSLHPKSEWLTRLFSLNWAFVYPFSGGSGPLAFYVSFLVLSFSWLVSGLALVVSLINPHFKKLLLLFIIPISIIYNGIFIGEYSYGMVNGSAPKLLVGAVEEIKNNPDISMVTVYNDNGGDEVRKTGKYRKRLYTSPQFNIAQKAETINKYKEHYFVLDAPRVDPQSIYQSFFDSCEVIYKEVDKKISASIYDCQEAPDIVLNE